ncbi:MAG: glutamine--tRNA ligase/YqeY domain fusion protein, partial [Polyangiaceae bacterium]|nr:glutamine--tRNA ligase/YqeY domain fusion protein [Polyangiaceae bacterium]
MADPTRPDPSASSVAAAPAGASESSSNNFLRAIVQEDVAAQRHGGVVATRFPPEPNGYLHIGHAKSICLNFGLARDFGGKCNLRFDDSNPETEDVEYVESIARDVRWLGFEWSGLYYASDYFDALYGFALELVDKGLAYVCELSEDEIRAYRGSVTEPGRPSPYRDRTPTENRALLEKMRRGEMPDGSAVLRAKIDMSSPNMKMRDPPLYRIRHAHHYRQGDKWAIYPLYDFIHPLSDALEGITHSICTLEFENNRELYDWVLDHTSVPARPHQYEFARLNLTYTLMSKRKLLALVESKRVRGWDDPRMPTLAGMRRRGVTAEAIRSFCDMIGVAKANSTVDFDKLEYCVRDDLNQKAPRAMAVQKPLRVVVETYPEGETEHFPAPLFPPDVGRPGSREVPFGRVVYIERDDFSEEPPKGFHRLAPGREVRLRYAYVVRCEKVVKDADGEVVELRCSHDPTSRGGAPADGRKVKGTIHWVSAAHAVDGELRLYDRLLSVERPDLAEGDLPSLLNPDSLVTLTGCKLEPELAAAPAGSAFQFERLGYFAVDPDSRPDRPVFNRVVTLRDTWAKLAARDAEATATPPPVAVSTAAGAAGAAPKPEPKRVDAATQKKHDARRALGPEDEALAAELEPIVASVLVAQADAVARYRAGKTGLAGFLVGEATRAVGAAGKTAPAGSGPKALAKLVDALVRRKLEA